MSAQDPNSEPQTGQREDNSKHVYFFHATGVHPFSNGYTCEVGAEATNPKEARAIAIDTFGHNHIIHELVAVMDVQP